MEPFGLAKCFIYTFTLKKITKLSATEKILPEKAVKYNDASELRDEQRMPCCV
jgi:hypothetical protein